ncbi:hypothetical protein PCCS19_36140 [Paenibacillus sp. CCS19]|uniref:SMEK domain-containing protein n=1 Tax=Paenibacillus sp. CCS19 TaxID=3158387 RepID=UPI00256E2306|nr:SMEK domain-containing protein [Paenibacillus cellulosilyticus]GMK40558.1 hypothetical protein PCCS19_36140 [Paenibacillus cellulosilyticus]
MNKEIYLKIVTSALAQLVAEVEIRNRISLFDINILAEDFYRDFLKLIFGYELVNLNIGEKNSAAIDLADDGSRIAIQVTSDNSSTKINETIRKFNEKTLHTKYDRLLFIMLTRKKSYTASFNTQGLFQFSKADDIIDYLDLIEHIKSMDVSKIEVLANFLETEVTRKLTDSKRRQASEVETITDLIEFLSSNKKVAETKKKDSVIDPDNKINKRFKEYSEFLKDLYIKLVSIYSEAVNQATITLGLDDVKTLVIQFYLQDISNTFLDDNNGDPRVALEELTSYFEEQLSQHGKVYDKMAIKYYLISETIQCNVFPNVVGDPVVS